MAKPVTIRILGDASNLEKALGGVNDKLGKFGKVAGAAVAGAAAGVAAFGVSSIGKFTEFETGMAEVFTLMPGMSEEAMSAMEQQVLDLSNQMGILPGDAIPALYDAISAGVPTDNVFQFMEDASKLAIGGSIETSEAVDVLSTSVNAWSESNLSAADAGDYLFTTVKLGKTTMAELNSSLSQVAPTAAELGVGLDEVGASLAVLTAGGMPTAQAATAMKERDRLKEYAESLEAEVGSLKGSVISLTAEVETFRQQLQDELKSTAVVDVGGNVSEMLRWKERALKHEALVSKLSAEVFKRVSSLS